MANKSGVISVASRSRRLLLGALALALLGATTPARADEAVKVSLNAPFDGSNAAFFLAEERGYYAAEGIKPTFDPSGGSGEAVTRIGSGTYEFGFGDINVLLDFNAKNPANAGKAIYMLYYRSPLSIGSFAKAGISKPSDLVDKKIGGSLGDGAYKLFPAYAAVTGIKADSIKWSYGDLRLRESMLLKGDVDGILGFDSTMYFNLVRQGIKPEDIKFLYYSDAGMDIYGNAILASKNVLTEQPALVKGFVKATARGWQDAIKDPKAAIAAIKKRSSLVNEAIELEKLEWLIKNQLVTAESKADGLGGVRTERFAKSVSTVAEAFQLPNVKPEDVFDPAYLPDSAPPPIALIANVRPFVEISDVSLTYPGAGANATLALEHATLSIDKGEFVAVVGPSGCGKSTLLKLVSGLHLPTRGGVIVASREVAAPISIVGMAFQNPVMLPWRTTLDNILLPLEIVEPHARRFRANRQSYIEKATALLKAVGLEGFGDRYPWQLSGGMQQRASLCRALIHEPALLLLDEPFGALDAFTREELWAVLRDLWATQRFTVILVTHDLTEAVYLADKVHVCSKRPGRIVTTRTVDLPHPRDKYAPEFVALVRELHDGIAEVRAS